MNFITKVGTWFKTHMIVTIIIGVVAVGGVTTALLLVGGNASKLNPDTNSNILPDGTYSCELRYNGKSLDTDQEIKDYFNKLYSKFGDTIDVDSRIKDLRTGVESFRKYQIVKNGNIVELMAPNKNNNYMALFSYDITNDKLTPRNTSGVSTDEKLWQLIDNSIDIKQTGTDFTFGNYYITITMYLPMIMSGSIDYDIIEKIEKQLSDIGNLGGDLVCSSNISSSTDNVSQQPKDPNEKYLGKYVGTGSSNAKKSYVELFKNNKAQVNINSCGGWTTYNGTYTITKDENEGDDILYIKSFSIWNGEELDMPDALSFVINDNSLWVFQGYIDNNKFDCAVDDNLVKE